MGTTGDAGDAGGLHPADVSGPQEFASALTALRHRAGVSIRKLGAMTGIPPATLGGYFSGRHLPSVSQADAFRAVLRALGVEDEAEVRVWLDAVRRLRARPGSGAERPSGESGGSEASGQEQASNPYPGLQSYTEDHADRFFGREAAVAEVLELVEAQLEGSADGGLVAVVGPSGAGKSSLLRGGVVPALRRADPPVATRVVVPGADPLAALREAVRELAEAEAPRRLLVVDQFEEIFGPGVGDAARREFIEALADSTRQDRAEGAPATVAVFGVRADFYPQVLREPLLLAALQHAQVVLGPMGAEELRRAVVEPARAVGVRVDDALVELVRRDVAPRVRSEGAHEPGVLPLLSHALMTAWERRRGDRLTVADYLAAGGIAGSVQASAEKAFAGLSVDGQQVARVLFGHLVNVDEDGVLTRRRVPRGELADLAPPDGELVDEVVERFIAGRLLTVTDSTVEITHEALLDAWPRLFEWVEEDREALRARRRVANAAQLWIELGRDASALLRGAPLVAATELLEREERGAQILLTPTERAFVEASRAREGAELAAERRRSRRLAQMLAVTTVTAILAAVLAGYALDSRADVQRQRELAARARDAALSRQVAGEADRLMASDPILAKQLALAAHEIAPTLKARSSLLDGSSFREAARFVGPDGSMHASVSSDGSLLAFAGADGKVRLWARGEGDRFNRAATVEVDDTGGLLFASALSPDRRILAVGGISGTVTLLDVANPAKPQRLVTLDEPVSAVQGLTFSSDGTVLAAATSDPAVHRWLLAGEEIEPLAPIDGFGGSVQSVAFTPDDEVLATGGHDGTVRLWDAAGDDEARLLSEITVGDSTNFVLGVAVSPDGRTLAAGAKDKRVRLWDISRPDRPRPLDGPATTADSFVNSVAFSPDGSLLAAGSSDGTARVWDTATGEERTTMPVSANVTSVAFTPDGEALLTGALDGIGRYHSLETRTVDGFGDNIWSLAYDDAGTRLLVGAGTDDGAIHLYDVPPDGAVLAPDDTVTPLAELRAPDEAGVLDGAAALSPDGSLVAGGTSTGHVVVWEAAGESYEQVAVLAPSTQLIEAVTFDAGGRLLASIGDDGAAAVWDTEMLRSDPASAQVARVKVDTIPLGVALSPDGRMLAVGAADDRVHLWRLEPSGAVARRLPPLTGFENYAIGLAFSPDGRLLAAGSSDASVRVWDVSDPGGVTRVGRPLLGPNDTVYSVAWDDEGRTLAGASTDGSVWMWDLGDPEDPRGVANLLALGGDAYTVTFTPDGERVVAAGSGRVVRMWDTDPTVATDRICAAVGTPLTRREWTRYAPGARYRSVCG